MENELPNLNNKIYPKGSIAKSNDEKEMEQLSSELKKQLEEYSSTHTYNFDVNKDKTPEQLTQEFYKAYNEYLEREFDIIIKEVKE